MISDEAVRVVEERLRFYTGSPGADWTAEAIAILEAAAPYIRAEALLDAAQAAIDPTSEDMDKYFIDQSDTGRWLRARAAAERPAL